ncbi:MAG: AAA family ATPase [Candidatus Hodarchaeota archaeon]
MDKNIPVWRIKYLPNKLIEINGRGKIKERLNYIIEQQNFPHLLLVGPNGIGKTTIARLFSKEFLGEFFEPNFKMVYANVPLSSEERAQARSDAYISTSKIGSLAGRRITTPAFIQVKVKPFVQLKALGDVPYKILIVKNFEALGSNQQGFRRLMEIYGSNCRMILITTKISSVIDPIISRCQIFLIPPIDFNSFKALIFEIAMNENFEIDENVIELLYRLTEGKIAKAIDLIQLCSISSKNVDIDAIYQNFTESQNNLMRSLLLMCIRSDFPKARDLARKIQSNYKYNAQEFFILLLQELLKLPISNFTRNELINFLAEADFKAIDGQDIDIQVSTLLSKICYFSEFL